MIGAEGTLGIITAVSLKLVTGGRRADCGLGGRTIPNRAELLGALQRELGDAVEGFETLPHPRSTSSSLMFRDAPAPGRAHRWNCLIEVAAAAGGNLEESCLTLSTAASTTI